MSGTLYTDTLTLSGGVVIQRQSIGVASAGSVVDLKNADGYLGVGPASLTVKTLLNYPEMTIPTVIDNLLNQGTISERVISYFFAPILETEVTYGRITFGGIDPADHIDSITYTYV